MGGKLQDTSKVLVIASTSHDYRVFLDSEIDSFDFPESAIIIADDFFREKLSNVKIRKIFVEAIEEKKSLEMCTEILGKMQEFGATKETKLIAVGGGIIQDITTLVASLYMRGIDWIYFPTTKMSQLDSCIGGKSSINLQGKKNIVGNIYPPLEIHIDYSFDISLSKSALVAGYLEAIKISFAHGSEGFSHHLKLTNSYRSLGDIPNLELNSLVLSQKAHFVQEDEFDKGIRQNLNFGHTFGHALESSSSYAIHHGIAIGIGMLMAVRHPLSIRSSFTISLEEAIFRLLKNIDSGYIDSLNQLDDDDFITFFLSDKKHTPGKYSVIIPGVLGLEKSTQTWDQGSRRVILDLLNKVRMDISNEIQ